MRRREMVAMADVYVRLPVCQAFFATHTDSVSPPNSFAREAAGIVPVPLTRNLGHRVDQSSARSGHR